MFEALAELVAAATPALTAAVTGLSEAAIERVAVLDHRAVQRDGDAGDGFASSMLGYRALGDLAAREDLAPLWNIEPERIPLTRVYAYPDMIEAAVRKEVRALWIIGTNPAVSFPNNDLLSHAPNELEFLVVSDGFASTPTTEFADLVLLAAIWGEKDGRSPTRSGGYRRRTRWSSRRGRQGPTSTSVSLWRRSWA